MNRLRKISISITMLLLFALPAKAEGIFSQIVLPFDSQKTYSYKYNKSDHALVLEFKNTAPSELTPLEQYDERLIRRLLIKDLGPVGTEVRIILRDRDVKAYVTDFNEPFRITIDIFDASYEEGRNSATGMPVISTDHQDPAAQENKSSSNEQTPSGNFNLLVTNDAGGLAGASTTSSYSPIYASNNNDQDSSPTTTTRRLLQPTPELFTNENQIAEAMKNTADGIGKNWGTYPPYIYRAQTLFFEGGSKQRWSKSDRTNAVQSAKAMADYAGKLYNFGNENKALLAYQQVLYKDSSIFDRDALHLFKFAEINLGQGNLTLARGYYNEIVTKFPESPLAKFAKLRALDIRAIRLLKQDRYADLPTLMPALEQISISTNGDLNAMIAIRKAYWSKNGLTKNYSPNNIPQISEENYNELSSAYTTVQSRRSKFHAANLILNHALSNTKRWSRATADFAANYFKEFDEKAADPWRQDLKEKLYSTLNSVLQQKVTNGDLVSAIDDYDSLPKSLKSIKNNPKTAWALAEAYRKLGQSEESVNLYSIAATKSTEAPDRFKAEFWLAQMSAETAEAQKTRNGSNNYIQKLRKMSQKADADMMSAWNTMTPSEQDKYATAYKTDFEKTITQNTGLKTPAKITLLNWTKALSTKVSTDNGGELTDWNKHFSPSGSSVYLLRDLAKRFSEMGLTQERRETLKLLKSVNPSQFADDRAAKKIWANELISLAEDYRTASQNLDAGRIYAMVGKQSEDWEGRAEALYKGGLLLFKAGRREEALNALNEASNDGNNLFYANLAKERLSQIK